MQAFLNGCLADHLASRGRAVPGWAALNRLAHADHDELLGLLLGRGPGPTDPPVPVHAWAEAERQLAARVFATDGSTPEGLARVQREALVPLELSLAARWRRERMGATAVLVAGTQALERYGSQP